MVIIIIIIDQTFWKTITALANISEIVLIFTLPYSYLVDQGIVIAYTNCLIMLITVIIAEFKAKMYIKFDLSPA